MGHRTCEATTRPDGASGGAQCTHAARQGYRTCAAHADREHIIPVGRAWNLMEHVADVRRNKGNEAAARLVRQAQDMLREAGKDQDADELPDFVPAPVRRLVSDPWLDSDRTLAATQSKRKKQRHGRRWHDQCTDESEDTGG